MIRRVARRWLGLPPRRCGSAMEAGFVPMRDGVRLATFHVWPVDVQGKPGTVVIRTPYGAGVPSAIGLAARLIAESGHHVIVQDVRGRYGSEGRFVPFEHERTDGADTLRWVVEQPWCSDRVGLFGASYLAYTAWCALAEAPEHVGALVSVIGSGDVYGTFYRGGAFCLSTALEWGVGVGEREGIPARRIDLARGLAHLPLRDADRVARKTVDWVRDWIDHPRRDAFWKAVVPELPLSLPPTVSIAGWYDFFLECQLRDHAALEAAARDRGTPPPRLIVGPWAHGLPARPGWWRQGLLGNALREAIAHFDAHLRDGGDASRKAGVRFFLPGREAWLESASWPPPDAGSRRLFLGTRDGRGVIVDDEPVDPQPPLRFAHDPAHPTPTIGGALFGLKAGIKDQRALTARPDVLVYESGPLERELTIAGPVRVCVHLETDAEDVDVTARLIDVGPRGRAVNVCDGITRARWRGTAPDELAPTFLEPGRVAPITIELGNAARTFGAGHALRVVVGASNFPRFDRNPGVRAAPALAGPEAFRVTEQVVHHDGGRRSWLEVQVWDPGAPSG